MNVWRRILYFSLSAFLCFSLASCGDDAGSQSEDNPGEDNPGEDPGEDPGEEPSEGWSALLLPAMATDIDIPFEGSTRVKVMLVSTKDETAGDPIAGASVKWGIETGNESINLAGGSSSTMNDGVAQIAVRSQKVVGSAVVVASSPQAPKTVKFNVNVLDIPTGTLQIAATYAGNAPVQNFVIKLYDGNDVQCASFIDGEDLTVDPLFPPVDGQNAEFENLQVDQRFAAIAYGYAADGGAPLAVGCLDSGLVIRENEATYGNILLETIDLNLATTYRVRSYYDLGDVASALGSVGKFVTAIGDFAANPGGMLYDLVIEAVKAGLAGWAGSVIDTVLSVSGLKDKLLSYLNGVITSNQTVCKVGLFGCQFRNVIRMMEFVGELNVQKRGSVELNGTSAYDGFAAYWRMAPNNCPLGSDGNYLDPNCGRMLLTTKQIGGLGTTINFLEGAWQGSLANGYNRLSIESHELKLSYGKIVVHLINNLLLPKLAGGANNFNDAIAYWINCTAIGNWLSDTLTIGWLGVTVTPAQGYSWCKSAASGLGALLNFATAFAELQQAGSDIIISGTATFQDTNADNTVDDIVNGNWSGSMSITTKSDGTEITTTTGVKGIWSAYNQNNVKIDGENIYCTSPKSDTDSNDQDCAYPPINYNALNSGGLCNEYLKCAQ